MAQATERAGRLPAAALAEPMPYHPLEEIEHYRFALRDLTALESR
jgi:hypothetical protein